MTRLLISSRSRLVAIVLATLLCLPLLAGPSSAKETDDGNVAEAVNEKDGSSVFDVAFEVRRVSSGVVDQTNTAVAYANCESCQTVAIAIQIVLVSGTPDTVTPTNVAVALNENCTTCQTLAIAYQFVFGTGDVLEFTREGRRMLRDIRKELKQLGKSGLTVDEIRAGAEELRLQIQNLLATQVVPRGGEEDDNDSTNGEESGGLGSEEVDPLEEDSSTDEGDPTVPEEEVPEEEVPEDDVPADPLEPSEQPPPAEPEPEEPAAVEPAPEQEDPNAPTTP